jgi:uncharacterized cupin superfamily protein
MNNSRMGRVLPDVAPVDLPLVTAMLAATDAFGAGRMDVVAFQAAILDLLRADPPQHALAPWIEQALAEQRDQVLARRSFPDRDDTIQVIYVAPGEAHPCHCHHNVTSTQVVLTGTLAAREFDRVDRVGPDTIRLRLLFDGTLHPGDYLQARDGSRNAHWFAAGDAPATLLNFNIRGYETETFYPLETRPLGRRLLDPTAPAEDGLLLGRVIGVEEAYARFGRAALAAFALPATPVETAPRSLAAA